jgi:hypothetical protein
VFYNHLTTFHAEQYDRVKDRYADGGRGKVHPLDHFNADTNADADAEVVQ